MTKLEETILQANKNHFDPHQLSGRRTPMHCNESGLPDRPTGVDRGISPSEMSPVLWAVLAMAFRMLQFTCSESG